MRHKGGDGGWRTSGQADKSRSFVYTKDRKEIFTETCNNLRSRSSPPFSPTPCLSLLSTLVHTPSSVCLGAPSPKKPGGCLQVAVSDTASYVLLTALASYPVG